MSPRDRDIYTAKTPPRGIQAQTAAPEPVDDIDEITSRYQTPEGRAEAREQHPLGDRVAHLEAKSDRTSSTLSQLLEIASRIGGSVETLVQLQVAKETAGAAAGANRTKIILAIIGAVVTLGSAFGLGIGVAK